MRVCLCVLLLPVLWYASFAFAEGPCLEGHDFRFRQKNSGLLIADLKINGTQSFSSQELSDMASQLVGTCTDDSSEEVADHLRFVFQNIGYFAVDISVDVKALDPLGQPRPVSVQAQVSEGPRYKLAGIEFIDHPAFPASTLEVAFPTKKGDVFERDKIASGLEQLRKLYGREGYLDASFMPDASVVGDGVLLTVTFAEGPQYHMGKLEIFAKEELANKLRANWEIREGEIFDSNSLATFVDSNHTLLPADFTRQNIQLAKDCPSAIVGVRIVVDTTSYSSIPPAKIVRCDTSQPQ